MMTVAKPNHRQPLRTTSPLSHLLRDRLIPEFFNKIQELLIPWISL